MTQSKVLNNAFPLMEAFYTIQGEGAYSGTAAYFVRLGGCDVGCHWCDVKESWDASLYDAVEAKEIIKKAKESGSGLIVMTGGEPLMYDLSKFTELARSESLELNIETSGAYSLSGEWDWICFSPKKFKQPREEFYSVSHELKVVIYNKADFKWAEEHANRMNAKAQLFLQPEWSKEKELLPSIVEYVKNNPKWRISLQTHKYMDIP